MPSVIENTLLNGKFPNMISFFSITFFVFLPLCVFVYFFTPKRLKGYCLLGFSLLYYFLVNGRLLLFVVLTGLYIYFAGIAIDGIYKKRSAALKPAQKADKKKIKAAYKRKAAAVLILSIGLILGTLLTVKYSAFFAVNINTVLSALGVNAALTVPKLLMPLGISFYSLQALSYIFDIYLEKTEADKNPARLMLFLCFFPQIVEGPICRYGQTAEQLWQGRQIQYKGFLYGSTRILYGLMKKLVIADRLNTAVGVMFDSPGDFSGGALLFASVCYTVQLYADFSGTMDAICGISEIFGVTMPENFRRPFFARTVSEFWQRWHITLGAWFKDYIFFPVTMSKPMKRLTASARKGLGNHYGPLCAGAIALFCVWLSNGLWHGSAWSFIFFGMYHFFFILLGNILMPVAAQMNKRLHINPESSAYRAMQICRTSVIVVFGEMFFRANGLKSGLFIFKKIFTCFRFDFINAEFLTSVSLDAPDLAIVLLTLFIIFLVSRANERGVSVRDCIFGQRIAVRWAVLFALIFYIIIFGAYGVGYIPVDPMYADF